MSEDIKGMAQARRVITQLRGLVAERDAMLGKRPCQNSRCLELNAARALLRETVEMGNMQWTVVHKVQAYLDACDTLEGK